MIRYKEREDEYSRWETQLLRRVLNTEDGVKVLAIILTDLQVFAPTDPADVAANALKSYGAELLEKLGAYHEDNLEDITRALLRVKIYRPPEVEPGDN